MVTKTSKQPVEHQDQFSPGNAPNFLTRGVEIGKALSSNLPEETKDISNLEEENDGKRENRAESASFGFYTPESKVMSFSSGGSRRSSSSRWNSSSSSRNNGAGFSVGQPSSMDRRDSNRGGQGEGMGFSGEERKHGKRSGSQRNNERGLDRNGDKDPFPDISDRRSETADQRDFNQDVIVSQENIIDALELRSQSLEKLVQTAAEYNISNVSRMLKHNIISAILKSASGQGKVIHDIGVVELVAENFGFLRYTENNYAPSSDNIYISQNQVKRFGLKTGDIVEGYAKEPRRSEKYFPMFKVLKINEVPVEEIHNVLHFDNFVPIFPNEKLNLDINIGPKEDVSTRVIDIIAPIGKGQRALIVAPPRSGKTVIMKNIAHAINANHPDVKLIVLLIDERPEEFTDMTRSVKGEVVSSTFDEPAERHVALAEIIISKAKRMVEQGKDVVILLDSITRLARAYNAVAPSSGKILTGGIDSNALQRPKRFFGAARNITGSGSLTIIATALVDTGSKMDEVIFEEFKGRGNSEIVLDRRLADKRMFPALDVLRSGTRNEEEMVSGETLSKMWALRKIITGMNEQVKANSSDAIDFLLKEIRRTGNNGEFFNKMNG